MSEDKPQYEVVALIESPLKVVHELVATKTNAAAAAQTIHHYCQDGELEYHKAIVFARYLQEVGKQMSDKLKEFAADEIALGTERGQEMSYAGAKLSVASAGRYDYSDSSFWAEAKKMEAIHAEIRKNQEKFMQAIPENMEAACPHTGEMLRRPHKLNSAPVPKITLGK